MTTKVRALSIGAVLLTMMWLAGCDHYGCTSGATFGNSSCTASGSGLSGSGGGTNTSAAYVYAVDEGTNGAANGTIDGYALDTSVSTFGPISTYTAPAIPLNNGGTGMAVAQGVYLYAAIGSTNQIYGWTITSSGALTQIASSPFTSPAAGGYIGGVGQANMIVNPAGTLLFISDAVTSSVYVYSIGSGGVLTEVGAFSCPTGFTPINLATDGLGKYLYVINGSYSTHQGSGIAAFSIGTGSSLGTLTPVTGSPFTGTTYAMWQVAGDPTGKYLIGTTGRTVVYNGTDDKNLYVFSIGTNGALTLVTTQPTVYTPFSIAVPANTGGELVYSFGFNDDATAFNPVEGYAISSTGTLKAISGSPFSLGEGSWGQFDQSGTLLFSYASYIDQSTNTIVTQISPLSVGSGGALSEPIANTTLVTPGFWAVADVP
jgi:6-phosphogluconolactonase (cycloisomerase 2 family)